MVDSQSIFLLRIHQQYKQGLLLNSGGLLDQPAFYMDAMEFITSLDIEHAKERQ